MALTLDQHKQIYRLLADETAKADRAFAKAKTNYYNARAEYGGGGVERETAAVLLSLREAQKAAAYAAASSYFDAYIKDAA